VGYKQPKNKKLNTIDDKKQNKMRKSAFLRFKKEEPLPHEDSSMEDLLDDVGNDTYKMIEIKRP
jgi:hypothetical protein